MTTDGHAHPIADRSGAIRTIRRLAPAALLVLSGTTAAAPAVEHISRTDIAAHIDADGPATGPFAVSANGRFAIFASEAGNLVASDGKR